MLICPIRPQLYSAEECLALTLIALRVAIDKKLVMYVDWLHCFSVPQYYCCLWLAANNLVTC